MLDEQTVEEYLHRIGAHRPAGPDLAGLRHLQERHVLTVPFENLGYHLDEEIHLGGAVIDKIVRDRRGGGCYETNPAFGLLLTTLGYEVEILPGRVYRPTGLGPPYCHLALRVTVDGEPWLVDTGFGRNSRLPLRFSTAAAQPDPHGTYHVRDGEVTLDDKPLYRLDDRPAALDDFRPTLWWWRTCPDSPFLQDVFCSLPTADGRVTLKGRRLTIDAGGERVRTDLTDDAAVLAAYRKHFGFDLDRLPRDPLIPAGGTTGITLN
ncbi:arylamine N-acetyltransferase [Dactylosporangium sp. NPDC051484]|uniref:arylamine N-acetyltransferase family protein n=1 Tax=Dactylosporangium sp. NPDC051484 TaxID=3154942 RepID=UPI00344CF492